LGLILPVLIIFLLSVNVFYDKNIKQYFLFLLVLIIVCCLSIYIFWPFLWSDPLHNFGFIFKNMSKFRWESMVLINGLFRNSTSIGWDYIPIYFSTTNPLFFILTGIVGIIYSIFSLFKNFSTKQITSESRNRFLFLSCFFAPVAAVIYLHSVLYDSWRHFFFIYPSFILMTIDALHYLFEHHYFKRIALIAFFSTFFYLTYFNIHNFPFQSVYFNSMVRHEPEYIRKHYEQDYWGVSYKQIFEYILAKDPSDSIKINVNNNAIYSKQIIKQKDRNRLNFVSFEEADYFVTNYRYHPQDYIELVRMRFYSIKVNNSTINEVFKMK